MGFRVWGLGARMVTSTPKVFGSKVRVFICSSNLSSYCRGQKAKLCEILGV